MEKVLETSGLTKSFGGLTAVNNVDFHVDKGEIVSIIGPNGAGKTTFFNLITGIYEPTTGTVKFNGELLEKSEMHKIARKGISRTFQNIRLFKSMTIEENIMIGQYCRTNSNLMSALLKTKKEKIEEGKSREKVNEIMHLLNIYDRKDEIATDLSYGYQRRVEIARAMATEPVILLLDEPAAGMNTQEKVEMQKLIKDISKLGYTILVIEHDMKLVMDISDRIIVLDYGNKIAEGTPKEIQYNKRVIEAYLGKGGEMNA